MLVGRPPFQTKEVKNIYKYVVVDFVTARCSTKRSWSLQTHQRPKLLVSRGSGGAGGGKGPNHENIDA
jgi:hypothetical protein